MVKIHVSTDENQALAGQVRYWIIEKSKAVAMMRLP
jgi:hypothetical protein